MGAGLGAFRKLGDIFCDEDAPMPLTNIKVAAIKPRDVPFKLADARSLYLEVFPHGSKLWRWKYRFGGKEKRLALGVYPDVTLAAARQSRDAARALLDKGLDPSFERRRQKAAAHVSAQNDFKSVAEEYIGKMGKEGRTKTTTDKATWFLSHLTPAIGSMPVSEIDPQMLLAALRRLEGRGNYETAKKTRSFASRVFRYAVATGRASIDPAALLQGALVTKKARNYAAILDPKKLGELLRAIDGYAGIPTTRRALQILPHVFVRPGELRLADWTEFDLEDAVWTIPAGRMKMREAHSVPLSPQVLSLLSGLRELTGPTGYLFPALNSSRLPMSENTLNAALRRMGFGKDEVCAHGFRATASSLLNESGLWSPDAIEKALAHRVSAIRGTYHRGLHWKERIKMAAWWSNHLDDLKASVLKV